MRVYARLAGSSSRFIGIASCFILAFLSYDFRSVFSGVAVSGCAVRAIAAFIIA